jgi:hypothetical protein
LAAFACNATDKDKIADEQGIAAYILHTNADKLWYLSSCNYFREYGP